MVRPRNRADSGAHLPVVYFSPVPDGNDDDEEDVVGNRVDDAVGPYSEPVSGSASERTRSWGPRVPREKGNSSLGAVTGVGIEFA
jgi:hypothetical protein